MGILILSSSGLTADLADPVTLADALAQWDRLVLAADSLTASDSLSPRARPNLIDPVTLADAITKWDRMSLADVLTLGDPLARWARILLAADGVTLADAIASILKLTLAISDTLTPTDDSVRRARPNFIDPVSLSDVLSSKAVFKALTDALTVTDQGARLSQLRLTADALSPADAFASAFLLAKAIADAITPVDSLGLLSRIPKIDALSISDTLTRFVMFYRSATDVLTIGDLVSIVSAGIISDPGKHYCGTGLYCGTEHYCGEMAWIGQHHTVQDSAAALSYDAADTSAAMGEALMGGALLGSPGGEEILEPLYTDESAAVPAYAGD